MPEAEILHSPSYASLLEEAGGRLRQWIALGQVVVIAPSRAAADEFIRKGLTSGALGLHRFTLPQFAGNLAAPAIAARGLCMAGGLTPVALSARVTCQARSSGGFAYFNPVAAMPGFARALASTLGELRSQQVEPGDLAKAGDSGRDLARLMKAYEDELDARALADPALVYRLAAEAAALDPAPPLAGVPLIFLDVELAHACERRFVSSLASRAPRILAVCLEGDTQGNARWRRILQVSPRRVTGSRKDRLAAVRESLFSSQAPPPAPPDSSVQFFAAPGESMECVEIARRILALTKAGAAFDGCAILLRDPARYQPLVEEALRRAGVPAHFSRGANRPDPAGRAFLALLACAAEGCSASRFAEYLSLGQVPSPQPEQAEDWEAPADDTLTASASEPREQPLHDEPPEWNPGFGWEKLLVDAAVIGGLPRWKRRLDGLDREFELKLESARRDDPASAQRIERRREQLANLRRFAFPLIEKLADFPASAHWGVWLERLAELALASLRYPGSVLSLLAELQPLDEAGPVALDEVYRVLEDRLRFFRQESGGRRYGKVFVGSIEEARGRAFEVVFLPGLAEGVFPRPSFENPLLLDRQRARLEAELEVQDGRAARERVLLLCAAASAEALIWSYPNLDATLSRPRVPSFYALELLRACEGHLPGLTAFQKRSAAASSARLSWPAPEDPGQAIDDAEYDLACLRRVQEQPATGALRYLVELSPSLGRSLRARWRRSHERWSESDGLVRLDAPALAALESFALDRRPYSASALENFAACPYRFALHSIFGLRPREDSAPLEEMDPITRGELFHAVQFALFQDLQSRGVLPVTGDGLAAAEAAADSALNRIAAEFAERIAPAIERVWAAEVENLRTDLRAWLRDVAGKDSEWRPMRFEYGFGIPRGKAGGHDPASAAEPATICGGFLVRGSIDLVEEHRQTGVLRVVDHKTGRPPDRKPIAVGGGGCLQPLLYSLAGESLWKRPVDSGRLYYCTQRGGYLRIDIPTSVQSRRHLQTVLDTIGGMLHRGFLPAAPAGQACERCDYRSVCGPHEEDRVKRKSRAELEPLSDLRRLP